MCGGLTQPRARISVNCFNFIEESLDREMRYDVATTAFSKCHAQLPVTNERE